MRHPIQVLIADDSAVVRGLLMRALSSDPDIAIVGSAMHGESALRLLRSQRADVVLLDVEMPVMDGLTALAHILREFPGIRVVMVSSQTREGAETTIRALAMGAAECIAKPVGNNLVASMELLARELIPLVKGLGSPDSPPTATVASQPPKINRDFLTESYPRVRPEVIVIGSSTGGPNALSQVLSRVSERVTCPILIAQHMPPLFTAVLAQHLQKDSGRPAQEAVDGGRIEAGCIYIAPGNYHLTIAEADGGLQTRLNQNPPEHFCRPSVNPLFRSAATCRGNRTLAVMLTGMGSDGVEGTREIVERGGTVLAQDEASSVVWGMPGAVVREGLARRVLPLTEIGANISEICHI